MPRKVMGVVPQECGLTRLNASLIEGSRATRLDANRTAASSLPIAALTMSRSSRRRSEANSRAFPFWDTAVCTIAGSSLSLEDACSRASPLFWTLLRTSSSSSLNSTRANFKAAPSLLTAALTSQALRLCSSGTTPKFPGSPSTAARANSGSLLARIDAWENSWGLRDTTMRITSTLSLISGEAIRMTSGFLSTAHLTKSGSLLRRSEAPEKLLDRCPFSPKAARATSGSSRSSEDQTPSLTPGLF
mmetsp:Transcript_92409/g.270506  ORF Transcript_92409/g.270506 Transcript_92409/m.270506 type:complete len:246 (-) Transcript_92409:833-1570(-)